MRITYSDALVQIEIEVDRHEFNGARISDTERAKLVEHVTQLVAAHYQNRVTLLQAATLTHPEGTA